MPNQHPQAGTVTAAPPKWVVLPGVQTTRDAAVAARAALANAARAFEIAGLSTGDLRRADAYVDVLLSNPEPEAEASALRALAIELEFLKLVQRELARTLGAQA